MLGSFKNKLVLADWRYRKMRAQIDQRIQKDLDTNYVKEETEISNLTIEQLDQYFQGKRQRFDIPLQFVGTDFQQKVWQALTEIPFGKTLSYKQLSEKMNNPLGIRAIANANGANAISIIVPCHRVIGSSGQLVGYAGGLAAKQKLLQLENVLPQKSLFEE